MRHLLLAGAVSTPGHDEQCVKEGTQSGLSKRRSIRPGHEADVPRNGGACNRRNEDHGKHD